MTTMARTPEKVVDKFVEVSHTRYVCVYLTFSIRIICRRVSGSLLSWIDAYTGNEGGISFGVTHAY